MTTPDTPDPAVISAIARSLGRRGYGWIETVEKIHIIFQEKILNTPVSSLPAAYPFPASEKSFTLRTVACIGWAEGHESREEQAAMISRTKLRMSGLYGKECSPIPSHEAIVAGASFIAAATVGERLRKAHPPAVDRFARAVAMDNAARAVADASIAWARSTGDCHFCDMNEKDHEQDCVLLPYELAKLDAEDPKYDPKKGEVTP